MRLTSSGLEIIRDDPSTTVFERGLIAVIDKLISYGDSTRLAFLLSYAGIKPETVNENPVADISDAELLKMIKEKLPELEKAQAIDVTPV